MKKSILIILTITISLYLNAQSKTYTSKSALIGSIEYKEVIKNRTIVFSNDKINISNFKNGNTQDLVLKIDSVIKKSISFEPINDWYYCTDTEEDIINGTQKAIVIHDKQRSMIKLYVFVQEVTVFEYQFAID